MAAEAAGVAMPIPAPGLVDLPDELFALIAPYLSLNQVCRLRATCHRLLRCSAVLAGGCQPQTRPLVRGGECAPEAVLAWAVGRRHMAVQLKRTVDRRAYDEDEDFEDGDYEEEDDDELSPFDDVYDLNGDWVDGEWVDRDARTGTSGVEWCIHLHSTSEQAEHHLASLSPAIRCRLAMKIGVTSRWLQALEAVGDVLGFGSLVLRIAGYEDATTWWRYRRGILAYKIGCSLSAVQKQLTASIASVGPYGMYNRGHTRCRYAPYELRAATAFAGVATVYLAFCSDLVDVSALAAAKNVDLSYCYSLTDVSALRSVCRVSLRNCPQLTDVSALAKVYDLSLRYCPELTDVSMLAGVTRLTLERCSQITDVSALGGNRKLTIRNCRGVRDVSALGSVHSLAIKPCEYDEFDDDFELHGISELGNVHELQFEHMRLRPEEIDQLSSVYCLTMRGNDGLVAATALGNVHALDLSWCKCLTDVSALGAVSALTLHGCSGVKDVSALGHVQKLDLSHCYALTDVSALGHVQQLDLSCCWNLTDISALGGNHVLNLGRCNGISDVSTLGGVDTLDLSHCDRVVDVSALGAVRDLNLSGCSGVVDVSALGNVARLNLTRDCLLCKSKPWT